MRTLLICLVATALTAFAQDSAPQATSPATQAPVKPAVTPTQAPAETTQSQKDPYSANNRALYAGLKKILLRSAEVMPEQSYSFKPTEAVRTYGQMIAHVAEAQYLFCSLAVGEKNPAPKIEQTKTSKTELVAALQEAFSYCDKAYDGMTDASGAQVVNMFGKDTPKLGVLTVNLAHGAEHYGNLVTYMRMKNIVPPTSEQPTPQPAPKK